MASFNLASYRVSAEDAQTPQISNKKAGRTAVKQQSSPAPTVPAQKEIPYSIQVSKTRRKYDCPYHMPIVDLHTQGTSASEMSPMERFLSAAHSEHPVALSDAPRVTRNKTAEIQATFHTNVFAHVAVTQAVLPYLRAQKSGTIAFMESIAGWEGGAACEVASFGIKVTVVEPGYFRTNFLASGSKSLAKNPIADYDFVLATIKGIFQTFNGNQPGDSVKGAQPIVEALNCTGREEGRELPRRWLIGPDAVGFVTGVIEKETKSIEAWKDLSATTNLDQLA
ncbi:uncharacterized protein CC84DRAFT_1261444 [Paraphaeosphaeria sporulosa]|uniref:NAD(P)-binding protein n=1 Tax=Paraphaeosphaeria sporulosa TaxID=1460663 RepID=A0A177C546_9PLEO|nr:uncharacterized protein CC84DRAFT_1261444 [Paraphaeosphaeria sporulosa]OAG02743.1 hypothetical protein CC84DRAFT_1261444 [Paraphaeosphaeria sporulosa]